MKHLLQEYLLENRELALPGLGAFEVVEHPANYDVADRRFTPPVSSIVFHSFAPDESLPVQRVLGFLALKTDQSEEDLFEDFQQYSLALKASITNSDQVNWEPLGYFIKEADEIKFQSSPVSAGFTSLAIDRVIREGASHQMKVGDNETTTTEMEAFLNETTEVADRWWLMPLLIVLGAIVLIIWKRFG